MRIFVQLVAILYSLVLSVGGPLLAQESECHEVAPPCSHKIWGSMDLISWTPHMRGLDFAATEDGTALAIGSGQIHGIDYDRDVGVRAQLGVTTNVGWSIGVGYTHFGTEGVHAVDRPIGAGQLFSTYSHPGGPEEAETAVGSASIDYDVFDLVARHSIVNHRFIGVDLFGGFRWADINQEINASFNGRDFVNGVVANRSDVNAFGIRFGGQSHWRMAGGWSAFGATSLAALYGKIDNHRLETNFDGAVVLVDLRDAYVQPVFNLDTSLGLAWQRKCWQVSGGYELNVWTNLGDNLRFVDDIEESAFTSLPGDLLLEGFFFRIAKTW